MSCPNCFCPECSKERAKWLAISTPIPYIPYQPYVPTPFRSLNEGPPGVSTFEMGHTAEYWMCGCGRLHPAGYVCSSVGVCGTNTLTKTQEQKND